MELVARPEGDEENCNDTACVVYNLEAEEEEENDNKDGEGSSQGVEEDKELSEDYDTGLAFNSNKGD
ncbi:hypothetical protein V5O48_017508, partial [Marasmius crinis-equi]